MSYTKTNWQNFITPLNASNMNKIEQGIYDVYNRGLELISDNNSLSDIKTTVLAFEGTCSIFRTVLTYSSNTFYPAIITVYKPSNTKVIMITYAGPYVINSIYENSIWTDIETNITGTAATENNFGMIKASSKTETDTVEVKIDSDGRLWTTPSVASDENVKASTAATTQAYLVGINANGYVSGQSYNSLLDTGIYLTTTSGQLHLDSIEFNNSVTITTSTGNALRKNGLNIPVTCTGTNHETISSVQKIWIGTIGQYNAITTKDNSIIYLCTE